MCGLTSMSIPELAGLMEELGQPKFRARQVFEWISRGKRPQEMTNLPKELRDKLDTLHYGGASIYDKRVSAKDGTIKYLFQLEDGNIVEGVLMSYHYGNTMCISTQVGCRMGCAFCASTLEGLARSLSAGEILGQVIAANRDEMRIHNIVLMGSGEPLDNYEQTVRFLRLLREPGGLQTSLRAVSLSTCGLPARIRTLAEEGLPVTLSVSLHAPDDAIRAQLMPVARSVSMDELLAACRYYLDKTGRRVIFEYALIAGVNSRVEHAAALASRLRGMQCHVNLIPLNPVPERGLAGAEESAVQAFRQALEARHISVTVRREMGRDIAGACGQLRRGYLASEGAKEGNERA